MEIRPGNDAKDYIGSVRIPLRQLLTLGNASGAEIADCFPVKDSHGIDTGRMEVRIAIRDSTVYAGQDDPRLGGADMFITNKYTEQ